MSNRSTSKKKVGFMDRLAALPKPVKITLWVAAALFAYALPLLEPPIISTPGTDFGGVLFTVTIYCLVALGLNIVVGYAGLLDLGYVGFYAIGAYTVAILTSFHASWPLLLALPMAMLATTISGLLLGAPTLRVLLRHAVPATFPVARAQLGSSASALLLADAALAFLGLGPADGVALGALIDQGVGASLRAPHVLLVGTAALCLGALTLQAIADPERR